MKKSSILCLLALTAGLMAGAPARAAAATVCEMRFTLSGWSAIYKTASGRGTITCDNGQKANVSLDAKGGGLTAGKYKIRDGYGKSPRSPTSGAVRRLRPGGGQGRSGRAVRAVS